MGSVNETFAQLGEKRHQGYWSLNWEKAERMLRKAGIFEMYKSSFRQSVAPVMRNIVFLDKQDTKDSLYIEAVK